MRIYVNGEEQHFDGHLTLVQLLARFELAPQRVAVEVNEQLVRRADFETAPVRENDRIEIVTLVGGG